MKKVVSFVVSSMLALSLGVSALATDTSTWKSDAATTQVKKSYTISEGSTFPAETLSFTSTADSANPDATNLTVDNLTVSQAENNTITVHLPEYSKVGLYHYTIKETAGNTQGVTYSEEEITLSVLVEYDDANSKLKTSVGVTNTQEDPNGAAEKKDTFTNTYDVGTLTVKKEVTGNLADKDKYFDIKVTLTAQKDIKSDITISGGSNSENPSAVSSSGWTDGKAEVTLKLKSEDTVTFSNIPAGVTYSVEEDAKHQAGTVNGEEGYTVSYTDEEGTIEKDAAKNAVVTNNKETALDTGISLENLPYFVILAIVLAGAVIMMVRRRRTVD